MNFKRFLIFHKTDDGADVLRTGDRNPDGTAKASEQIDEQFFADAVSGSIKCEDKDLAKSS